MATDAVTALDRSFPPLAGHRFARPAESRLSGHSAPACGQEHAGRPPKPAAYRPGMWCQCM